MPAIGGTRVVPGSKDVLANVNSVTAADASAVVTPTTGAVTVKTGTFDAIATAEPPVAAVPLNAQKITGLANGSGAQDAAAFGQIPTALPPNGTAGGDLSGTYPNPAVANVNGVAITAAEATLLSQLNGATTRAASASAVAGEETVLTGTTASQTLTLPASTAQVSSINTILNLSTQNWTVAAGAGTTLNYNGTVASFALVPNSSLEAVLIGTVWYVISYTPPPPPLARAQNAPSVATTYNLVVSTTGLTAVDTTNLKVIFFVPPSGNVRARCQAFVKGGAAAATSIVFGLVSSTGSPGTVVGVLGLVNLTPTATAADNGQICTLEQVITGLTPGASLTWYFAAMYSGTAATAIAQGSTSQTAVPTGAPALVEVLAA